MSGLVLRSKPSLRVIRSIASGLLAMDPAS